jgi:hypothetical protein
MGIQLDNLDKSNNLDNLDSPKWLSAAAWVKAGVGVATWSFGLMVTRVTQVDRQRVTIWKNVCLLFSTRGTNFTREG